MREAVFLNSPDLWALGHGRTHPLKPERLRRAYELLQAYNAFEAPNARLVSPEPASEGQLALFHERPYIDAVKSLSEGDYSVPADRYNFGPGDNPVFDDMYHSERLKVGSSLKGAELLLNGECSVAFSYGGGLHHAGPANASGFCVFNDAAVAIQWLLEQGQRVAYVDIDVHHGDGVQDAFYEDERVLTISIHQDGRTLFPGTGFLDEIGNAKGRGYSVNLPLPPYCDNDIYLWAFEQVVTPLVTRFAPDILVTQLGVDTHYQDPLASLALTTHAHQALFQAFEALTPRWLALGGGGYNLDVVPRSWALAFGVMSGQSFADELPASYRSRYGGEWLHDHQSPRIDPGTTRRVRQETQAVVARLKIIHAI
jgi:acetoin utilization protein AcuC